MVVSPIGRRSLMEQIWAPLSHNQFVTRINQIPRFQPRWQKWQITPPTQDRKTMLPYKTPSKLPTRWARLRAMLLGLQPSRKLSLISWSSKPVTWAMIPLTLSAKTPRIKRFCIVWGHQSTRMLHQLQALRFRDSSHVRLHSPSHLREAPRIYLYSWLTYSREAYRSNSIPSKCRSQSPTRKRIPSTLWSIPWPLPTREPHQSLAQAHRRVSSKNSLSALQTLQHSKPVFKLLMDRMLIPRSVNMWPASQQTGKIMWLLCNMSYSSLYSRRLALAPQSAIIKTIAPSMWCSLPNHTAPETSPTVAVMRPKSTHQRLLAGQSHRARLTLPKFRAFSTIWRRRLQWLLLVIAVVQPA